MKWRVFWVPRDGQRYGLRSSLIAGWEDLPSREDADGIRAGDPIFLAPDCRVDPVLGLYGQSAIFRSYREETRRNYATDMWLWLSFLWRRGRTWRDAMEADLEDYEHWRRFAATNPQQVGGSKWNRELAAFTSLYGWALRAGHVARSPVAMRQVVGRRGEVVGVAEARAKDARPSNVHWLTPRTWRMWVDIGLRGHGVDGVPAPGWAGRLEDRNVALTGLLTSSGLRRSEGGSLLTFEVPARSGVGGRYRRGRVAAEVTRSKKTRTYYVASEAVGDIETYVESSREWVIRRAQRAGRYEELPELRLVHEIAGGPRPVVHWRGSDGVAGRRALDRLSVWERQLLFTEGAHGLEPLWLWLNERGLPFQPHSWEGVFRTANQRCARVLAPSEPNRWDPHRVFAPYATPHSARHSFALYMLVVLNCLMDQRYGLTPEERRDFRLLYGDPWFMVQNLLGHASRETTIERYLAPVADLQLRALLATVDDEPLSIPTPTGRVRAADCTSPGACRLSACRPNHTLGLTPSSQRAPRATTCP